MIGLFLVLADYIINYFQGWVKYYNVIYDYMKIKAFKNKLIYYAMYNTITEEYMLVHNYNTWWSVVYFYFFNNYAKMDFAGITFFDLDMILHSDQYIVITSYIVNNKEYYAIYDYDTYTKNKCDTKYSIVYAYTDKKEELSHEFEKFKHTVFDLEVYKKGQYRHVYNILSEFKKHRRMSPEYIKLMLDNDFEEQTLQII